MKFVFLKCFAAFCVMLAFCSAVKAQMKQDSAGRVPHVWIMPGTGQTEHQDKSVYKLDSTNSRMPVLPLVSNDKMPAAKLPPLKNYSGRSLKLDSLKERD